MKDSNENNEKKSQAQRLIDIAKMAALFVDAEATAWADFRQNGHRIITPVKSREFRSWLREMYYATEGKPPSSQPFSDAINQIEARALYDRFTADVHLRFGTDQYGTHYMDIGNHVILRMTPSGWDWDDEAFVEGVRFWRPAGYLPIALPEVDPNIEALRPFLNIRTDDDFVLVVAWLLTAMNPAVPTPILTLQGEQGSAKSTTARLIRSVIDPSEVPLRPAPRDERDLYIAGKRNAVMILDNLSGLKPWLSDSLCRICTGGGFSTRRLYSDDDEIVINLKRPVILNGIDAIATRGDLMDRSIVLDLPAIPPGKRVDEEEFWSNFNKARPAILAGLLDGYVSGLANQGKIRLPGLPRMADFAKWTAGCEKAYDWPTGTILNAYRVNRGQAVEAGLDADITATAIRSIMADRDKWQGTATELVQAIRSASPDGISDKLMPTTRGIKNNLARLAPALRETGIEWEQFRDNTGRYYEIRKSLKTLSPLSPSSQPLATNGLERDTSRDTKSEGENVVTTSSPRKSLGDNAGDTSDTSDTKKQSFLSEVDERGYPASWDEV